MSKIKKIVITGGPCSGKSTITEILKADALSQWVELVPEVATMLLGNGFPLPGRDLSWSAAWQREFQQAVAGTQVTLERASVLKATEAGKGLLVCDRGLFDGPAYMNCPPEEFCKLCRLDLSDRDEYATVLHLESLAVSEPGLYEELKSSNPARFETAEEACEVDGRLWDSWLGHSHHVRVNGSLVERTQLVTDQIRHTLEGGG